MMQKSSFFIAGRHAVIEALKNQKRRVLKIFFSQQVVFIYLVFFLVYLLKIKLQQSIGQKLPMRDQILQVLIVQRKILYKQQTKLK